MTQDARQAEIFEPGALQEVGAASVEGKRTGCKGCKKPLTGRQTVWCSSKCNNDWYAVLHPRINVTPQGPRRESIKAAILGVLHDGEWHTKADLALRVRAHEHSVGTRISELRCSGFRIESDLAVGNRTRAHRFRLVLA